MGWRPGAADPFSRAPTTEMQNENWELGAEKCELDDGFPKISMFPTARSLFLGLQDRIFVSNVRNPSGWWNQRISGLPHVSASLLAAEWVFSISGRICMVISSTLPQKCMKMPELVTFQVPFFKLQISVGGPIVCNGQRQVLSSCRVAEVLRSLRREVFSTFVASPQKELPKEGGRSSGMQINAMISLISSTCLVVELRHMIL